MARVCRRRDLAAVASFGATLACLEWFANFSIETVVSRGARVKALLSSTRQEADLELTPVDADPGGWLTVLSL